jgi:hypothetical protein
MSSLDFTKRMQPVEPRSILRDEHWYVWGGGIVRTEDGTCHYLFARWPRERGFNAWVTHSEIAHATSPEPLGPWTIHGTVLGRRPGAWDADSLYNPTIHEFDGKYYLYYTGNYGCGEYWDNRNHQRVGIAVADHPAGPYQRFDHPLLDVTKGSHDHLMTGCPTVARRPDGTYFLIYKGVSEGPMPFGGEVRMSVATANHPAGPFTKHPVTVFATPDAKFPSDDNFIWWQDDRFYAIVKDQGGFFADHGEGKTLVLFESADGFDWRLSEHSLVSRFQVVWEDRMVTADLTRLDQPQVWLDHGKPAVLLLSVKKEPDSVNEDLSYCVQVSLKP